MLYLDAGFWASSSLDPDQALYFVGSDLCSNYLKMLSADDKNRCYRAKSYEGDSISNQPDLFLTGRHSQDFHSAFGHHIKTICIKSLVH